jgi:RNA polymerase sigma factor (sigma-70 family)
MADGQMQTIMAHLRKLLRRAESGAADWELLERFAAAHDETAFEVLVWRHHRMVLSVCGRALADTNDVEDAFQATFLVLARKAGSLRRTGSLAGWLFGVARRVALETSARRSRRHASVPPGVPSSSAEPCADSMREELRGIVDEEIARLSEKYRAPTVLCYLEGMTYEEAAQQLGWSKGTVSTRLARAREVLRKRLAGRGVVLSAGALAGWLCESAAPAAAPGGLVASSVKLAGSVATAITMARAVAPHVAAIAEGVLNDMLATNVKMLIALVLPALVVGLGLGMHSLLAGPDGTAPKQAGNEATRQEAVPPIADQAANAVAPALDHYGDPLPPGAIARLGTVRFRTDSDTWALTFSRDGKMLVGNTGGRLVVWDAATGKEHYRLPVEVRSGHRGGGPFAVSPDGTTLAVIEYARPDRPKIGLWELRTGKQVRSLDLPVSRNAGFDLKLGSILCYAPDGNSLAMTRGGTFLVLDVATGKVKTSFGEGRAAVYSLAYSPDGKTLAVATHNPALQLWDIASGKMIRGIGDPEKSHAGAVAFSADGKMLAAGGWDRIVLHDPGTGKELKRLEAPMQAVNGVAFTPDGTTLVSGAQNGGIRIWDVAGGSIRFTCHPGMIGRSMALSPDGATAAMGTGGEQVCLWSVATGKQLFTEFEGHGSWVNCVHFSPEGKTLASGEFYWKLRLWDTAGWKPRQVLPGRAWSLAFSPDGKRLASVPRLDTVDLWNLGTGEKSLTIKVADTDDVRAAMFTANGRKLITLDRKPGKDGRSPWEPHHVRQWDAATGKEEKKWLVPGHMYEPVLAPGGMAVLVATGNTIRLHDVPSGRDRLFSRSGKEEMRALAVSPDGRVLASGDLGQERAVRFWDLATGQEIHSVKGHQLAVTCAAWSPDGRMLASGDDRSYGGDQGVNTIRLWDGATGKELAHYGGINTNVTALAFSPDGAYLAAGLRDSTILVWDVRPAAQAARREARPLTSEELAACWAALADRDAHKAHQAAWTLVAGAEQAVPFLRDRLRPVKQADTGKIERWLADLGSAQFSVREAAAKALETLDRQAEAPIQQALAATPPLEARRRLERVLDAVQGVPGPGTLQDLRAIMVLEKIGLPEAKQILTRLAGGAPAARQTREASESLRRLGRAPADF